MLKSRNEKQKINLNTGGTIEYKIDGKTFSCNLCSYKIE